MVSGQWSVIGDRLWSVVNYFILTSDFWFVTPDSRL